MSSPVVARLRPASSAPLSSALLVLLFGVGALALPPAAASAVQPPDGDTHQALLDDIEALFGNVYDQRMARQFGMDLELPPGEVAARLEVFGRWLDATQRGAFPGATAPPEDLVAGYRQISARLSAEQDAPSPETKDAVLLFLEENVERLREASGLEIELPM